ncbi:MAG: transposase [Sedimenticola sp.]
MFFEDGDYRHYIKLLSEAAEKSGTEIWAYCLMPNHVHLILVPAMKTACVPPWAMRIGAIPALSMPATNGPGICGRDGLARSPWMRCIWRTGCGMFHSTPCERG